MGDSPGTPLPTASRDDTPTAARLAAGPDDCLTQVNSGALSDLQRSGGDGVSESFKVEYRQPMVGE